MLKMLGLLMWKNYLTVKHSWCLLCLCFICEVVWFSLTYNKFWHEYRKVEHPSVSLELDSIRERHIHLFYSPSTIFTDKIMKGVTKGVRRNTANIYPCKNFQEMYFEIYNQANTGYALGINFNHAENVTNYLPKTLAYEIWEVFNVSSVYQLTTNTIKQRNELSNCKRMICIQGAIDKSFIDLVVTNNKYKFFGTSLPTSLFSDRCLQHYLDDIGHNLIHRNAALSLINFLIIHCISKERILGGKRLMNIAGVPTWCIWFSWLITVFAIQLIPCIVISIYLYVIYFNSHLNFILVYILIIMYSLASISSYFFVISVIPQQEYAKLICFSLWLFSHMPLTLKREDLAFKMMTSLLPQMAIIWGYGELEEMDQSKCSGKVRTVENWSLSAAIAFLAADCVIYMSLAWVIDGFYDDSFAREFPKQYQGQSRKLLPEMFNVLKFKKITAESSLNGEPVAISIRDLTHRSRWFSWGNVTSHFILSSISMDILKNHMTFVIGSAEAGLSTFISIIMGDVAPTCGIVTVDGMNPRHIWKRGLYLGICLQQPLRFFNLSAKENLMFFSMFRGCSIEDASVEADMIMQIMNIKDIDLERSTAMRKKICVGMALIGAPPILVLDEPTIGLDVEARKDIWLAVNFLRRKHTILVTTRNAEEADNMADIIAILHQGCVQAYGSNLWLKRQFGSGYNLSLNTYNGKNTEAITEVVQKYVPEATIIKNWDMSLTYSIPFDRREEANAIINAIEEKETELGVLNIYIDVNTLGEIYQKISLPPSYSLTLNGNNVTVKVKPMEKRKIWRNQVTALIKKKLLYIYRFVVKNRFLGLMTFLANASGFILYSSDIYSFDINEFSIEHYKNITGGYLTKGSVSQSLLESYRNALAKITHTFKLVFKRTEMMDMSIAAEIIEDGGMLNMNALYGPWVGDICLKSVNTMTNAALHFSDSQFNIIVQRQAFDIYLLHNNAMSALFYSCVGFVLIMAYFPLLLMEELINKTKQMQYLCGISGTMYWSVFFFIDFICYMVFTFGVIAVIAFVNENIVKGDLIAILILSTVSGLSVIPVTYLHTFIFKSYVQITTCIFMEYILSLVIRFSLLYHHSIAAITKIFDLYPVFGIISAMLQFYTQMSENACARLRTETNCSTSCHPCCIYPCINTDCYIVKPYFVFSNVQNPHGIADEILSLSIGTVLIIALLFMINSKRIHRLIHQTIQKVTVIENNEILVEDSEVIAERELAHTLLFRHGSNQYLLAMHNLSKIYRKSSYSVKHFSALNAISMTIKKGEYFGILGCNDAGKTVLVKMIVGNEVPNSGNIKLFSKNIGYCPQDAKLFPSFTAYETLTFFATIRGLSRKRLYFEVGRVLKYFGLWENKNMYVKDYNCVDRTKLGIAVAMIGDPEIVIMDTPLIGVDPITKKEIWETVQKLRKPWQGIIVTSHLLEVNEESYTRFAGMKNGSFLCIGNWKQLRDRYNLGFSFKIHLGITPNNLLQHAAVKKDIESKFKNMLTLQLQTKRLLHYYVIDRTVKITTLVNGIAELQKSFSSIEDFTINKTDICELFNCIESRPAKQLFEESDEKIIF